MNEYTVAIQNGLKVLFYVIFPAIMLYLRIWRRVSTGFALGVSLVSFLVGVIAVSSVQQDPLKDFMTQINSRNFVEAKKSYQVLVQYGDDTISKIDDKKVIYKEEYRKIKEELYREYIDIATRYNNSFEVSADDGCERLGTIEEKSGKIAHGLKLLDYAALIGDNPVALRKELTMKLNNVKHRIEEMKRRCI